MLDIVLTSIELLAGRISFVLRSLRRIEPNKKRIESILAIV